MIRSEEAPDAVQMLIMHAEANDCSLLYPADRGGAQLSGAAIYAANGRLGLWQIGDPGNLLVVTGVVASTWGLQNTMDLVRPLAKGGVFGIAYSLEVSVKAAAPESVCVVDIADWLGEERRLGDSMPEDNWKPEASNRLALVT